MQVPSCCFNYTCNCISMCTKPPEHLQSHSARDPSPYNLQGTTDPLLAAFFCKLILILLVIHSGSGAWSCYWFVLKAVHVLLKFPSKLCPYLIGSWSSLSSLLCRILIPLFLARGHPDRLRIRKHSVKTRARGEERFTCQLY